MFDLADVSRCGAPPEAKQLFQQGAAEFADLQDDLEPADTRPELEAVYPRIVDAVWRLESAKAVPEGQPAPAQPGAGRCSPSACTAPPAPAAGAPLGPADLGPAVGPSPQRGLPRHGPSPWLTTAATAARTMLMGRMMAPERRTVRRPPTTCSRGRRRRSRRTRVVVAGRPGMADIERRRRRPRWSATR